MARKYDVSVVGLYILDVLGRPVVRIPDGGNVDFIEEIRLTVAGTAGGTVMDLAKLGLNCLAVGAVGDDEKADFVIDRMRAHGIDCHLMQRLPGVETSATILNVRPNGERPALHARGASDHFDIDAATLPEVLDCRFLHLGGDGSIIAKGDARIQVGVYDIKVVDTTGCGDAYTAGFIAGLADDRSLEECAHLGTASASLVASGLGSEAGIIDRAQVEAAMAGWRA